MSVAVCCSAFQCVAVRCRVLQCVAVCGSVSQCVAVCCRVLQYVAVCCSALPCAAVWYVSLYVMCVTWSLLSSVRQNIFCVVYETELILCHVCYRTHSMSFLSHNSFSFVCVTWLVLFHVCAMTCVWCHGCDMGVTCPDLCHAIHMTHCTLCEWYDSFCWDKTHSMTCELQNSFYVMCVHDVCDAMVVTCPVLCHVCPRTHCTWCVCDMTRSVFDVRQNAFYAIYVTELILFLVCYMTCCISCVWRDVFYVMCVTAQHTVQRISHTDWVPCVIHVRQKAFFAMCVTELILFHECDTHITHRLSSLGDRNHSNPHIRTKKSL